MNAVIIANAEIVPIEFNGERVVTYQMIADIHGVPVATIQNGYARNSEYFIDGEDTYLIDFHENTFRRGFEIPPRGMRVFTESGYLMLVKTLRDETAWRVQRELVRNYFRGKKEEKSALPDFTNPAEAARAWANEYEQKVKLEQQLAIAAPKVEFADRVGEASGILIGNYAKVVGIGPNKLFAWMRDHKILIASGSRRNVPMQEYMDRGYFTVKETAVNTNHGIQISFTTKITGRGQQWLTRKLLDNGMLKVTGEAA
ncbi:TPA: phage antirepressor Ant [Escherichia coli]|nr:phage antirepressor Ant [Escherichia coli]HAZ3666508.1 phage antirepressor Ant [Escherichia coli]HBA8211991.1 phage antirepressor Ant [Escherichia coli]